MKKAISIWSFASGMSPEDAMELAARAGFDGIELALEETGPTGLESTAEDAARLRQAAERIGIALPSVATGLYWGHSLTSGDAAVREKAKSIARKEIDLAVWLGAEAVLVVPGAVGVDFIPGCEVVDYEDAYQRSIEAVSELASYAAERGVDIAIENVWNKFLLSPLEFRTFLDTIDSPRVGAYLDVGNVLATGYPEHWIRILGNRIKRVHVKDYRRAVGSADGFVDLLSGDVDYPKVTAALRTIGYDGWLTAEMIPPSPFYKHYPDQLIYNTAQALGRIIDG